MSNGNQQRRKKSKLCSGLAVATTTLLAQTTPLAVHAENWTIDTGLLYYGEQDDRVQDISFKSVASKPLADDDEINLSLQLDTLTGASPSGALPIDREQTITSPSGNGQYTVAPGERPLDDSFKDTRAALTGSLTRGLTDVSRYTTGVSLSKEYDYLHLGANASYSRDFNQKNTTVTVGVAYARDTVEAVGGSPEPLTLVSPVGTQTNRSISDNKDVVDGLLGVTQILNRRSLLQFNYSIGQSDGYLNDPYKLLTVLDSRTGEPIADPATGAFQYRYESRPDSRLGHNFYTEYKYRFDAGIANLSYRFHTDDWGIDSHTLEVRYRWLMDARQYLEPHIRYYTQSSADFYTPFWGQGSLQRYASSDYRLADFEGVTLGLRYNRKVGKQRAFGVSVETYKTSGTADVLPAGDDTQRLLNYPDLTAWIVQFNYKFEW